MRDNYGVFEHHFLGFCYQERAKELGQDPSAAQELKFLTKWKASLGLDQRAHRVECHRNYCECRDRRANWTKLVDLLLWPTANSHKIFPRAFIDAIAEVMWVF